jgi:ATP/maltotriose-dependent transcriptional regulator MalT
MLATRGEVHYETMIARSMLGEIQLGAGELDEAEVNLERALTLAVEVGSPRERLEGAILRARLDLARGDHDAGLARLAATEDWMAEAEPLPDHHVMIAALRAQLLARRGELEAAREQARAGLAAYEEVDAGNRPPLARDLAALQKLAG